MSTKEKILIVDDEQDNLTLYEKLFSRHGYQVLTAQTGKETFDLLGHDQPDLILLDIMLGNESGLDILKKIKTEPDYSHIFVVMITGMLKSPDDKATGLELGADGYITRPVEKRELTARIEAFLRHKRTNDSLRESEQRFRHMIEHNPDAILIVDKDGTIRFVNPAAEKLFHLSADNVLEREFGHPVISGEHTEINIVRHDNDMVIAEMRSIEMAWEGQSVFLVSVREITKRKKAEISVKKSEEKLRVTLNSIGDAVISTDTKSRISRMNPEAERLTGWSFREAKGLHLSTVFNIVKNQTGEKAENPVERVLSTGGTIGLANHTLLISKDGNRYQIADSGAPIRDDDGNIIGVVLVFRDVSEEYKLRQQVDASEKQFRDLYENAPNAYFSVGVDGIVHMCNKQAGKMLGYQVDDITGRQILDFYADTPFGKKKAKEILQKYNSGGAIQKEELQMQRAEGTLIWISLTVNAVRDNTGKIIESRSIAVDITDRKATDIALQKSKDLLEATGRMARVGGWELDAKTLEVTWTTETYRIHEVSFDHKPPLEEAIHFFHPEDREKLSDAIQRSLQYGEPYDMELRFITAKGKHLWTRTNCRPVVENGKTIRLFGTFQDITRQKLAEIALHHEKETAQKYLEIAGVIIVAIDRNAGITLINKKGCEILGYEHPELIGKNWFNSFIPGNIREDLKKEFKKLISGEKEADDYYENPVLTKQHEKRLIAWHNALLRDNEGNIIGTLSSGNDITERKKLEHTIRKNRERLARAQQIAHLGNWEWDIKKENLIWSEELYRIFGVSKEFSLTLEGIRSMIYPEDKTKNDEFVNRLLYSVDAGNIEFRIIRPDQSVRYLYQNVEVQRDKKGEADVLFGIIQDITERREAEEGLIRSEEKYRLLAENAVDVIWQMDKRLHFTYLSPSLYQMAGFYPHEWIGTPLWEHAKRREFIRMARQALRMLKEFKSYGHVTIQARMLIKDNKEIPVEIIGKPLLDQKGKLIGLQGSARDISERIKDQEKIKENERILNETGIQGKIGGWEHNILTGKAVWTQALYDIIGISSENEPPGVNEHLNFYPSPDREILEDAYNQSVEYGKPFELELRVFNIKNQLIWCRVQGQPVFHENKCIKMRGTFQDITEKKQTEIQLMKEKEFTENALDSQTDTFFLINPANGKAVRWNKAFRDISGYSDEEIANLPAPDSYYDQEDLDKVKPFIEGIFKEGSGKIELDLISKNGKKHPTEYYVSIFHKEEDNTNYIISIGRDITDRKKAENELKTQNEEYLALNEELEEHLERIKKMNIELDIARKKAEESDRLKSSFLANMSHEIRTPMNGIIGFAGMFTKKGLTDDKRNYYAKIVIDNSKQLLTIVNDILDISRIEAGSVEIEQEEVNVNDLINSLYAMYKPKSGDKLLNFIPFKSLTDNESVIISDKTRLKQVLDNLLNNAFKFTHEGEIKFGYEQQDEYLRFYVTDTGIGIAREHQDKIFEQFRQEEMGITRQYGGTGLGLAISKKLVNLLGGDIRVESEKGKGSSFYFTIPYKPVNQLEELSGNKKQDRNVERFTILVAEDEEVNYLYVEEELTGEGIQLILAKNGKEAVDMTRDNPGIDLILMDIKMPALDGLKATKMIKEFRPGLPIIAYTAYVFDNDKAKAMEAGCDDYLTKPLDIDRLRELIEKYKKNSN